MFYLIKSFLLSKWSFKFPLQKQILVYDSHSAELASIFFKKKNYSILNVRLEEINILILIKVLVKKGFKNLKNNYYGCFINYINPRLIITFVDNNLNFYKLKNFYPKSLYVSVQLSSRDNSFFEKCEKYYKYNSEELTVDYFFVTSLNDKRRYRKYIKSKYYVIGTVRNNQFYKIKNKFRKKKKVLFISQQNRRRVLNDFIKSEKLIFDELFKICYENKWNVSLCTKNSEDTELAYRAKLINGNWKFLCNKNVSSAYKAINEHDLIIFTNSTLGLEALIKRKKCISFPPDFFPYKNFNLIYPKEGPFWSCSFSREKLLELISNVENFNNNEWNIIIKKYIELIMAFDSKNKTFYKLLKQHKISTKI